MFVPYFGLYMFHIRQKQKIPDSYDKWKPGFEFAELPAHDENTS